MCRPFSRFGQTHEDRGSFWFSNAAFEGGDYAAAEEAYTAAMAAAAARDDATLEAVCQVCACVVCVVCAVCVLRVLSVLCAPLVFCVCKGQPGGREGEV